MPAVPSLKLPPTPESWLALLERIRLDLQPCAMDAMYRGPEERAAYGKHMGFMAAGASYRQRLFMAGNRVGKTEGAGGYELALHLTGRYPDWWTGRRFERPVSAWACGDTRETARDILQRKIIGEKGRLTEGLALVHPALFGNFSAGFIPNSYSTVQVRHVSGGFSTLSFKSYDQGREAFQGTEQDVILLDEEPPLDVYIECLTRTMTNDGLIMLTFTPLKGMSETVLSFFPDQDVREGEISGRHVTMASWDDAPHLSKEAKAEMLAAYPPFMRLARTRGLPQMGAGVIYPVDQESYLTQPFEIPDSWPRAYGLDVGWNVTAAVWGAYDRSAGCWHIHSEHYARRATPLENSHAIRGRGEWIQGVIDPAAAGASQLDGKSLLAEYRGLGLKLAFADNAVEAGILRVWTALSSGRLKIFTNCVNLLRELRGYIRDEKGRVVKENDHACDALRYLVMSGQGVMGLRQPEGLRARGKNVWVV
jgi:phage terminase large subunit-like protein